MRSVWCLHRFDSSSASDLTRKSVLALHLFAACCGADASLIVTVIIEKRPTVSSAALSADVDYNCLVRFGLITSTVINMKMTFFNSASVCAGGKVVCGEHAISERKLWSNKILFRNEAPGGQSEKEKWPGTRRITWKVDNASEPPTTESAQLWINFDFRNGTWSYARMGKNDSIWVWVWVWESVENSAQQLNAIGGDRSSLMFVFFMTCI